MHFRKYVTARSDIQDESSAPWPPPGWQGPPVVDGRVSLPSSHLDRRKDEHCRPYPVAVARPPLTGLDPISLPADRHTASSMINGHTAGELDPVSTAAEGITAL
jgi:hypothetical protein